MKIEIEKGVKKLTPSDETKFLVRKEELDRPVEERYYFQVAYIPADKTLEYCEELYSETDLPKTE